MVGSLSEDFNWDRLFFELHLLIRNKYYYDQSLVKKAGVKAIRIWGGTTTLEKRKDTLKIVKADLDRKEVAIYKYLH